MSLYKKAIAALAAVIFAAGTAQAATDIVVVNLTQDTISLGGNTIDPDAARYSTLPATVTVEGQTTEIVDPSQHCGNNGGWLIQWNGNGEDDIANACEYLSFAEIGCVMAVVYKNPSQEVSFRMEQVSGTECSSQWWTQNSESFFNTMKGIAEVGGTYTGTLIGTVLKTLIGG